MKVLRYTSGRLTMEDRPPLPSSADEVRVRVSRVGICGTDLGAVQRGTPKFRDGVVIGHELAGVRTDTGERVTVVPIEVCGRCDACRGDREQLCRSKRILGAHIDGVLAEEAILPASLIVPVPAGVTDAQAAIAEPMATALHAWNLAAVRPGASVGVIGGGAIGLCLVELAARNRVAEVRLAEVDAAKHAAATLLGATQVAAELAARQDVVFDCVGMATTRKAAIEHTVPGGTTVFVGLHTATLELDGNDLVTAERRILGSFAYTRAEFLRALEIVEGMPTAWVTGISLDEAVELINGDVPAPAGASKLHVILPETTP